MSLLLISVIIGGFAALGYGFFLLLRWFEAPDLLVMQYHYWREEARRWLHES